MNGIPALVLLGPTASGKTAVALDLAPRLGAEVISVDSRQVYRGMDIGTAKPAREELERVPHHLLDRVDPGEVYSAGRFRDEASAAIEDVRARGRLPILVGGTGLYFDALLRGLASVPPRDDALRAELERRIGCEGSAALHAELRAADPASAARIHPNDRMRLVRAMEIWRLSGRLPSEMRSWQRETEDARIAGLWWERDRLYNRIEVRLEGMMRRGFLDEVRRLQAAGFGEESPGLRTPGYREMLRHLDGRLSLEGALEETARATRQLARRQIQWFRARSSVRWLDGSRPLEELSAGVQALWDEPAAKGERP